MIIRPGLAHRPPRQARLALVLGSGGVRSMAAVGVVDRLAREGIVPDLVVGCSSGALFGAAIAMGMRADKILTAATALWTPELTARRRWRAYAQLVAPRLAGFDDDFALRDNSLIAQRLKQAFGDLRLESLPTPLRVLATDADTGRGVVLTQGSVAEALLASLAVPLIFPAVPVGSRLLVGGVVSDPLPVHAARDAAMVVALGFEGPMPRRVDRPSRLAAQASIALVNNLMEARLEAARANGQRLVQLALALDRQVGLWEIDALPYLYEAGRRAADVYLPQILAQWAMPPHRAAA